VINDLIKRLQATSLLGHHGALKHEAANRIEKLSAQVRNLTALLDDQLGTPCEQIRHQQYKKAAEWVVKAARVANNLHGEPGLANALAAYDKAVKK